MIPLWGIVYGCAWIAWLICVIGSLGNQKLLGLFSQQGGYQYSPQYMQGFQLAQMSGENQAAERVF